MGENFYVLPYPILFTYLNLIIYFIRGVKLLLYDIMVTDLSRKDNLLQYKERLHIIDPFLGSCISGSFPHQITLLFHR